MSAPVLQLLFGMDKFSNVSEIVLNYPSHQVLMPISKIAIVSMVILGTLPILPVRYLVEVELDS